MRTFVAVCLVGGALLAAEPTDPSRAWGVQVSLLRSAGSDLAVTTDPAPGLGVGVFKGWALAPQHGLRVRAAFLGFRGATQYIHPGPLEQGLDTRVTCLELGLEYRYQWTRWSWVGGVALSRWSVDSSNHLLDGLGQTYQRTGTSTWWRPGLSGAVAYTFMDTWSLEARLHVSRYGYEDVPTRFVSLALAKTF